MIEATPAQQPKKTKRTTAGVGPALVVGGLALLLAASILYPWGGYGRRAPREIHAAEGSATSATIDSRGSDRSRERVSIATDPLELPMSAPAGPPEDEIVVRCRVIDEFGHGVRNAEIWVDDGELRAYGRTAEKGLFELSLDRRRIAWRLDEELPVLIGARHRAHGPSVMAPWRRPLDEELTLILRGRGAGLRLILLDPTGNPIEGAEVVLGDRHRTRQPAGADVLGGSGTMRTVVPAPPGTSDKWGVVLFEGLEPGRRPISLFAYGYCARYGFIELIDGELDARRITLEYACALRGRLVRDDGQPVVGGRVLGRGEDPLTETQASCDENGEYYLERLPAGRVWLFAECRSDGRVTHTASAELELQPRPGEVWNPVLSRQGEIHGRLVDSRSIPLPGWRVELRLEEDPTEPIRTASTAEDGRFSLPTSPPGSPADLYLFHPLSAGGIATRVVRDVSADTVEQLHQLEPGEELSAPIRGRVTHPGGEPAVSVTFLLHKLGGALNYLVRVDEFDASFQTPAVPPGDYVVIFPTHGWGWTPDTVYHVEDGQALDVGTIELCYTGLLRLLPTSPKRRSQTVKIRIDLFRQGISRSFLLPIYAGSADLPLELHLATGDYRLLFTDRGSARPIEFAIQNGQSTEVEAPGDE